MANKLVIKRGSTTIADGELAKVDGCPLANCEHALDFVNLIRAAATAVYDRTTKTGGLQFVISREFSTPARALHHAFLAPQLAAGRQNLVVEFNDGSATHVWTLADAGWPSVEIEEVTGVRVRTRYTVSGGAFTYSGGSLTYPYSDAV